MLVSFTVRNFRSFRDEVTLDLRAPRASAVGAKPWDGSIQAVAGIYGANASGKTTLFQAMSAMSDMVRDSYRIAAVTAQPYAFDADSQNLPTQFSVSFIGADKVCYAYGFSILDGRVIDEWAERYTTARPTMLFSRKGQQIHFGAALKGPSRLVEKTMRPANLYLSAAAAAGHSGLAPLFDWFHEKLRTFGAHGHESVLNYVLFALSNDAQRYDRLSGILARADLGLNGVALEKHETTDAEKAHFERAREVFRALTDQELPSQLSDDSYQAYGMHAVNGKIYRLPIEAESDGTRAMLCHAFVIDEALRSGGTVVFDEIDASLHPLLVRSLVHTFQDRDLNPRQAQLLFTTHDVSLLDSGYINGAQLKRDEVWVTEKDRTGVSTLIPLADYSPRTRDNLARRYLSGRYGGIPDLVDLVDPVLV